VRLPPPSGLLRMNLPDRFVCAAALCLFSLPAFGAPRTSPAVIAVQHIREGETITADRLNLTPYLPAPANASNFSAIAPIAGRVAIHDIPEGSVVLRASVGAKPERQFKITPATALRVHASRRRGAVLPNAPQDYRQCRLDTSTLSADQALALRKDVTDSKVLLTSPERFDTLEGGYEDYRIAVTVGDVTKSVTWTGERAPPEARRLVAKYLDDCAAAGGTP
jgi:hypothetical protein